MPEFTAMERKFLDNMLLAGSRYNASESARRAGYRWPAKQAYEIARRPRVRAELERRYAERLAQIRAGIYPGAPRKR